MWHPKAPIKYLLLFLLLAFAAWSLYSFLPFGGGISLSPSRDLVWRDFKQVKTIHGRPGVNARTITYIVPSIHRTIPHPNHLSIVPKVEIGIDEELTQVSLGFLTRADKATKQTVLNHENGHYKIAQIIGKRIYRESIDLGFDPENHQAQFDSLVRKHFEDWSILDRDYDRETTNPRNPDKQREWDRFFRTELAALQ